MGQRTEGEGEQVMPDTSDTAGDDGGGNVPTPDSTVSPLDQVPPYEPDFTLIEVLEKGADTIGIEDRGSK